MRTKLTMTAVGTVLTTAALRAGCSGSGDDSGGEKPATSSAAAQAGTATTLDTTWTGKKITSTGVIHGESNKALNTAAKLGRGQYTAVFTKDAKLLKSIKPTRWTASSYIARGNKPGKAYSCQDNAQMPWKALG